MSNDKALRKAVQTLADQAAELIEAHSFAPDLGRVWAALLVSGDAQPAAAVAGLLDDDEAAVAEALDELVELGAARVDAGRYRAETDPFRVAATFIRQRELPLVTELAEALLYARDKLADAGADHAAAQQRLDELARHAGLVQRLLKLLAASDRLELDRLLGALTTR